MSERITKLLGWFLLAFPHMPTVDHDIVVVVPSTLIEPKENVSKRVSASADIVNTCSPSMKSFVVGFHFIL
ncbi:MAG: hypothetical protein WB676_24700 [Bryobacteraceae bacterium]